MKDDVGGACSTHEEKDISTLFKSKVLGLDIGKK
jgi:hypothetical protein